MSRNWCVGEFAGAEGMIQARDTRDQLRHDGIDAILVTTGEIHWVNVCGGTAESLMLAALYAKTTGEREDLAKIIKLLEASWSSTDRRRRDFYTLLDGISQS